MLFNKISRLCAEKGISISKLEKECKLGNATVRGWNKSTPRIDTLQRVANYLGVPIEELLDEDTTEAVQ